MWAKSTAYNVKPPFRSILAPNAASGKIRLHLGEPDITLLISWFTQRASEAGGDEAALSPFELRHGAFTHFTPKIQAGLPSSSSQIE